MNYCSTLKRGPIIFFAVDTQEVYMTTKLAENKTFFLPFNKGCDGGKGNPDNPVGLKPPTSGKRYLKRTVLWIY